MAQQTRHNYRDKVLHLLRTTQMSCADIGKLFGVSYGPIGQLKREAGIQRDNIRKNAPKQCKWCGQLFRAVKSTTRPNRGKYCSKDCYTAWQKSEANRGSKHPNWKHGPDSGADRKTEQWKVWRQAIYKRDDYRCGFCGQQGGSLHPHHIRPRRDFPALKYDIANGITLCRQCHMRTIGREYDFVTQCEATLLYRPYHR